MFPAISKVVLVFEGKPLVSPGEDLIEYRGCRVKANKITETIVQEIRVTVPFPLNLELVQVHVVPAHCGLDVFVQYIESAFLNLNPPPDLGFNS